MNSSTSEQACEGQDGVAYLQRFEKESSASLVDLETVGFCTGIQDGNCEGTSGGSTRCKTCDPNDGTNETIPNSGSRFTPNNLRCGDLDQCVMANSPSSGEEYDFFTFLNANDYIRCNGKSVCKPWRVKNVGAVCCSGEQTCNNDFVAILGKDVPADEPSATCTADICCDGGSTCYGSSGTSGGVPTTQFIDGRSMSCRGYQTCYQVWAQLSKDLLCSEYAGTRKSDGTDQSGAQTCQGSFFAFDNSADSPHCVTCFGGTSAGNQCYQATFEFNTVDAQVKMSFQGLSSGYQAKVFMKAGGCIEINCISGTSACYQMQVTLTGGATCHCTGSSSLCASMTSSGICPHSTGSNPCSFATSPCSSDPSTCCDGLNADATSGSTPPDCEQCHCRGSSSETTSSTSTPRTQTPAPEVSTSSSGQIIGDPHIDTFDGQHYLLLKQGSFSFWRFSGSDAEIFSAKNHALLKKLPVDFKLYAHYSGHTSYTKGLLLVDSSGATSPQRALELTSEDCLWRTKTKDTEWSAVEKPQLLSLPDADGDEMTAFRMTEPLHESGKMYVELLMKKTDGAFKKIANLYVRCKPGYHMNTKITMTSKEDIGLVQGQLGAKGHTAAGENHKASFLEGGRRVRSDSEFGTSQKWTDLGGSAAAETYLSEVDEEGEPAFLKDCSGQEKIEAEAVCKKYLGEPPTHSADLHSFENRLDSCIFDVCNGGGEVAAELAADIFHAE